MNENKQDCAEILIDLSWYIKVIVKRKMAFIAVFVLTFVIGITNILFFPKMYRISMMLQPPAIGQSLTGANDLETAENLKSMIENGFFNADLKNRLKSNFNADNFKFMVGIPSKTNILNVSIDMEKDKKESGLDILDGLNQSISFTFEKIIEARKKDVINQIKLNEANILNFKEKAKILQEKLREITIKEERLREELKVVNIDVAEIRSERNLFLKENSTLWSAPALFIISYLQNNANYLNQLNEQASGLSERRNNLDLELKNTDFQIINCQMEIDKLNINKDFISNLKIVAQPRVPPNPINPGKKKFLAVSIAMGLLIGLFTVFLQEFWVNNLVKK